MRKSLRVFVVDDEDIIASSLAMILRFQRLERQVVHESA